ncbi:hypothetical protein D3C79_777690 [compost metagenome]
MAAMACGNTNAVAAKIPPTRMKPCPPLRRRLTWSTNCCDSARAPWAYRTTYSPSSVGGMLRGRRSNRAKPNCSSRSRSILLSAGWLRFMRVAVACMLRVRARVSISTRCL